MPEWKFLFIIKNIARNPCHFNLSMNSEIEIIYLNWEGNKSKFYGSLVQKLLPWDFVTCLWKYDIQLSFCRKGHIFCNQTKVKRMILGLDISYLQSMHFNFEINYPFIILLSKNTPIRNSNVCEWKKGKWSFLVRIRSIIFCNSTSQTHVCTQT